MSAFVLEVLDGDQAGEVLTLDRSAVRIGRKPECSLRIRDEKCSGEHAEVRQEDGTWVLRDLGSTNGTLLDGGRIQEVALSAGDVFQVGRVRVAFRAADALLGDESDLHVGSLHGRGGKLPARRSGVLVTLLVLLLLGGLGALAWLQFAAPEVGRGPVRAAEVVVVPGNLLQEGAADFEVDGGWDLQSAGAGFEPSLGRRAAHTGTAGLLAQPLEDAPPFALARTTETFTVLAQSVVWVRGHMRSAGGGARAAIRLRFSSSADDRRLTTGTVPVSADSWQQSELRVQVPRDMDRVEVELLALLPDQDSRVWFDDLALTVERSAEGNGVAAGVDLRAGDGRVLSGTGASLRVDGRDPTVDRIEVLPPAGDPALAALADESLLCPSDVGLDAETSAVGESGFHIDFSAVADLVLALPDDAEPILGRGPDTGAGFVPFEGSESAPRTEVLFGHGPQRTLLRFPEPVPVEGRAEVDHFRLTLRGLQSVTMQLVFTEQERQARDLMRQARSARDDGKPGAALDLLDRVLAELPHAETTLRDAQSLRSEVTVALGEEIAAWREAAADARFFASPGAMERALDDLTGLLGRYGEHHVAQAPALRAAAEELRAERAAARAGQEEQLRMRLEVLAEALRGSDQAALAEVIQQALQRRRDG